MAFQVFAELLVSPPFVFSLEDKTQEAVQMVFGLIYSPFSGPADTLVRLNLRFSIVFSGFDLFSKSQKPWNVNFKSRHCQFTARVTLYINP
jgi:hypothetical protein